MISERRANFPCQLNSEKIKGAALCYLSAIVVDKCSVVSCKCTCNINEGLQKGWNEVLRLTGFNSSHINSVMFMPDAR